MSTSDREVITYMADDDFDLPRWSNSVHTSHLSVHPIHSSAPSTQYSLYGQSAPLPQQQQLHHDSPRVSIPTSLTSSSSRIPARLPHSLDSDSQEQSSPSMLNLSRTASINTGARSRRQQLDDLERAYATDAPSSASATTPLQRQQIPNPFYPSSVAAYQVAASTTSSTPIDSYTYYPSSASTAPGSGGANSSTNTYSAASRRATNASPAMQHHSLQTNELDSYSQTNPSSSSLYSNTNYPDYSSQQTPLPSYSTHIKRETPDAEMRSSPYIPQQSQSTQAALYSSDHSYPSMDTHQLSVTAPTRPSSHSNPSSPFPHAHGQVSHSQYYSSPQVDQMVIEPPPRRRSVGFKRIRDVRELRPHVTSIPQGRRMDHTGNYVGPLRALTTEITSTFNICNKQFRYETSHNPRRVLTKPSRPVHNDGFDNEDYDYILYVNDFLGSEDGQRYLILDVLGQGTFGQVVKCQNVKTNEIVAVKVIKNKPAYFNQSMMEVTILQMLNNEYDPHDEHHILRLRDSFIHKNHLCLVFEQLSSNLYELIKQNQFQGLSTQLVKVFTAQLLDALIVLKEARLIHCDLKPENILLKSLQSPQIKVIDFGSACHERQTVYTYIQSRFYRSPEVLLGLPYNAAIDMWSLGCIAVELFLGLPLFPGTSEYNQITRIVDLLGLPPQHMLDHGKQVNQFFDRHIDAYGQVKYRLKSIEQYSRERNTQEQPGKQYFSHKSLPEIVRNAPMAPSRHAASTQRQAQEIERENNHRTAFIDFCQGLLNLNPLERWSPQQAKLHPFITGEKFTRPFNPNAIPPPTISTPSAATAADPKRPYGGLLPSQPKGTRAYTDAASYNQQLVQHQVYTAQAQAASQVQAAMRNPYVAQQVQQAYSDNANNNNSNSGSDYNNSARQVSHQQPSSTANLGMQFNNVGGTVGVSVPTSFTDPNPPPTSYFPSSRLRANTVNQMDIVPPAIARLQQMSNPDVTGIGRNALTPVMQRDDAIREWERRRQSGKAHVPAQPYPQLEFLQQQAELAAAGNINWSNSAAAARYLPSNLSYQSQPGTLADSERTNTSVRDAIMSSVRTAARPEANSSLSQAGIISAPPQAYATGNTSTTTTATGARYSTAYSQPPPAYETSSYENRSDGNTLYMPVQPQQYQPYPNNSSTTSTQQAPTSTRHNVQASSNLNQSFYNSGIVPSGQPFASQTSPSLPPQGLTKDARRISGMDVWQR
ncbi:hypothetical protein Clacol_000515 [Clathrus columnatus]|uniref:Protein kinase domain-containing protein n=1 Tax=Clathrus columnatus TaxID=1419009 RepID=A0AAV5A0T5_9AGAM|nr:hypothetical protein Clacol_000515 [Clathrus columnatus]